MLLSNKLLRQRYVRERLKSSLGKFYGRYGDLIKQHDVPLSRLLQDILEHDHTHTLLWLNIALNRDLGTELYLITCIEFTKLREVSMEDLQRVSHDNKGRLLLRTPGPVPFGTWMFSNVDSSISWAGHISWLWISNFPLHFDFCLSSNVDAHEHQKQHRSIPWMRSNNFSAIPSSCSGCQVIIWPDLIFLTSTNRAGKAISFRTNNIIWMLIFIRDIIRRLKKKTLSFLHCAGFIAARFFKM